ncbi:hypothetical protein AB0D24_04765 [Streptomyces javensis]|uniref:hypothetical protein n=1 Tax=Streptomyces javensis TaxID=114698 RepID=UPI003405720B
MSARQPLTPAQVADLGEATGKIAAFAAKALHHTYPHLELEGLVASFTRDSSLEMIALSYLAGIDRCLSAGEAAGEACTALIRTWADARLTARARLDEQTVRPDDASTEPVVVCTCGTAVHDNNEARQLHADAWHSEKSPAVWGPPVIRGRATT